MDRNKGPAPASEDFAFMLEKVPGAYINLGYGVKSAPVHNDRYDFNDDAILMVRPFLPGSWSAPWCQSRAT